MKPILRILVVISLPLSNINIINAQTNFWEEVNNGLYGGDVSSLVINDSGHIFAGTGNDVYRSINNGDNWNKINNGLPDNANFRTGIRSLAINQSGYVFAGYEGYGVFRSIDNGDNWTEINNGITNFCQVSCHQRQRPCVCRD